MNATEKFERYRVAVLGPAGLALVKPLELALGPVEAKTVPLGLQLPYATADGAGRSDPRDSIGGDPDGPEDAPVRVLEKITFPMPLATWWPLDIGLQSLQATVPDNAALLSQSWATCPKP